MKREEITFRPRLKRFSEQVQPTTSKKKTTLEQADKKDKRKTTLEQADKKDKRPTTDEEEQAHGSEQHSFLGTLKKVYIDFSTECSIHGIQYLRLQRKPREKMFWMILLIIALIICACLIRTQYLRWDKTPVILSFSERELPVSHIPFPAVTVCTETKYVTTETVNFTRFYDYLKHTYDNQSRIVEPPSWLNDDEYLKMRALLQVCGNFLVMNMQFPEYPPFNVIDHLNAISPAFEINFLNCVFNDTRGDCGPLFEKIYTEEGICYTFNAFNETEIYREKTFQYEYFEDDEHIRKRSKNMQWNIVDGYIDVDNYDTYPERVIGAGFNSGLLVVMQGLKQNMDYVCRGPVQGFKVILHSPDDIPQVEKRFFLVPYEQDVLMIVTPELTYTTDNVKDIDPKVRKCYFPDERHLRYFQFYTQNNCEIECMSNFTLRVCGCVQFSMPRFPDTKVCDAEHVRCYDQADDDFLLSEYTGLGNHEEKCNCLPGCWTLDYNVELSHGTFNMKKILEESDYQDTAEASRVTIFFRANEFRAWKRSQFIGKTDFLAQCGGLFGVLTGGTLMALVQILYYLTIRYFIYTSNVQSA